MCEINVQVSAFKYILNTENLYIYNHLSLNINMYI